MTFSTFVSSITGLFVVGFVGAPFLGGAAAGIVGSGDAARGAAGAVGLDGLGGSCSDFAAPFATYSLFGSRTAFSSVEDCVEDSVTVADASARPWFGSD